MSTRALAKTLFLSGSRRIPARPISSARQFSLWGSYPSSKLSPKALVDKALKEDFIAVFSKTWCPYCKQAHRVLENVDLPVGQSVKVYELDELDDGEEILDYLRSITNQTSVPNIFVQGDHLGGFTDLAAALKSGRFQQMISVVRKV
ncbi:Glutaredoxin and related proteins [Phaffia rhodozyma]|uniref:Glutaredoxin and related proteins n=1 Tax=Phaffia rhodozyma TaxID=264483 RepID=A0A0F7SHF7_PHARH|nr:Glutaredoxin and related proteins [Phaffia rhodozyma]